MSEPAQELLRSNTDWAGCIRSAIDVLRDHAPNATYVAWAEELADLAELCCPDRSSALTALLWAWKADRSRVDLLTRARRLCADIGDPTTHAKILHLEAEATAEPDLSRREGLWWLRAGNERSALAALATAARANPSDEATRLAIAVTRCQWPDLTSAMTRLVQRAAALDGELAADYYLAAARVAHVASAPTEVQERLLVAAFRADPMGAALCELEALLLPSDPQRLVPVYRPAVGATRDALTQLELYRRGGTRLAHTDAARGAGIGLLWRGLEHAYQTGVACIPGHLASVKLVAEYAAEARLQERLLGVIDHGLGVPMRNHELLFLAVTGLGACRQLGEGFAASAEVYAGIVHNLAPDHAILSALPPAFAIRRGDTVESVSGSALSLFLDDANTALGSLSQPTLALAPHRGPSGLAVVAPPPVDEPAPDQATAARPVAAQSVQPDEPAPTEEPIALPPIAARTASPPPAEITLPPVARQPASAADNAIADEDGEDSHTASRAAAIAAFARDAAAFYLDEEIESGDDGVITFEEEEDDAMVLEGEDLLEALVDERPGLVDAAAGNHEGRDSQGDGDGDDDAVMLDDDDVILEDDDDAELPIEEEETGHEGDQNTTEDSADAIRDAASSGIGVVVVEAREALTAAAHDRDQERRKLAADGCERSPRAHPPLDAEIHCGGRVVRAVVRDISTTGLFLLTDERLTDDTVAAVIAFPTENDVDRIRVVLRPVRRTDDGIGCVVVYPSPRYLAAVEQLAERTPAASVEVTA